VQWESKSEISETSSGDLILSASLRQKKPVILQNGKPIEAGYVVRGKVVGFEIAKYDATKPLVIDPTFVYSRTWAAMGEVGPEATGARHCHRRTGQRLCNGPHVLNKFPHRESPASKQPTNADGGGTAFVTKGQIRLARRWFIQPTWEAPVANTHGIAPTVWVTLRNGVLGFT